MTTLRYDLFDEDSQGLQDTPAEDQFERCSTSASLLDEFFKDPNERYHAQGLQPAAEIAIQSEISAIHDQRAEASCKELQESCFVKLAGTAAAAGGGVRTAAPPRAPKAHLRAHPQPSQRSSHTEHHHF